ncbi:MULTISPECIES: hypothetical protein [Pseudomonas]|uniref:hypothetical protein n=1 Tax=Pseudomonas TaxID=286 RepID=UPI0008765295|nr:MULTISPECIES: hypothetical protein [Pseudomonas]SCZ38153.1 hypothetical protein SAMN03159313_4747 [Pseudomonas sp. NFIX46]SDB46398.1 hypothetical protein SAMN03097715_03430 [Pseudomonas putida]SFQ91869.1 hypothetical protein SAMN03159312_4610 [Pseudomonas sp. NFIX49]
MLTLWVFILMIEGQPIEAIPTDSETKCKEVMAKLLTVQRLSSKKASGACYVRASAIDDTERRLIGVPLSR